MSETQTAVRAQCEQCAATYHVPSTERTYKCKACDGTVRATAQNDGTASTDPPVLAGTLTCPACEVINLGGLHYCSECGMSLPESPPGTESKAGRRLRQEAADALKRVTRGFQIVTWTYHGGAIAYAVATVLAVIALARPDVPITGGIVVVGLTTLLSVLFGMGALHAHFKPFAWTVAIAVATTATTVTHLVGPNPFDLAVFGSAVWTLVAFAFLVPTYSFRKQIRKQRDLYVMHFASSETRRSLRGRSAEERHERLMQVLRRSGLRTWLLSVTTACLVVLASTVGSWVYLTKYRPAPFAPTLERFEQNWNSGSLASVVGDYDEESRPAATLRVTSLVRGHGWESALPELGMGRLEQTEDTATVAYDLDGVEVSVSWVLIGIQWELQSITIPVPDYRPALERFAAAWKASDLEQVIELYKPESRAERLAELQGVMAKQEWERLPVILETQVNQLDETNVSAVYTCASGKLKVGFHYGVDGKWYIVTLKLPRG